MRRLPLLLAASFTLLGCIDHPVGGLNPVVRPAPLGWRATATEDDRARLRQWRTAWTEALEKARAAGHGADIASEGALLDPDAALPAPAPPPGDYRCRTVKLGGQSEAMLDFVAYPFFRCRILAEDELMSFEKLTGSQRPVGLLFEDIGRRLVFLGTLQLGDETLSLHYGLDRERDMAGILERIGEARWRLVFPYPHFESTLDVLELVPADRSEGNP